MRIPIITALVLLHVAPAFADDTDRRLTALLMQHHDAPTRALLEAKVPDAKARLIAVSADPTLVPFIRDRAVAVLGAWRDEDVRRHLERRLEAETAPHRVILVYARTFPDRAVPRLQRFVFAEDTDLAATAVTAIATVPTREAGAALKSYELRELRPPLRAALSKAIERHAKLRKKR